MKRFISVFSCMAIAVMLSCSALAVTDKASYESVLLFGSLDQGNCIGHDHSAKNGGGTTAKTTDNKSTDTDILVLKENTMSLDGALVIGTGSGDAPLSVNQLLITASNDSNSIAEVGWRRQAA